MPAIGVLYPDMDKITTLGRVLSVRAAREPVAVADDADRQSDGQSVIRNSRRRVRMDPPHVLIGLPPWNPSWSVSSWRRGRRLRTRGAGA